MGQFFEIRVVFQTLYLWNEDGDPQFFFISGTSNSLSASSKNLKKFYWLENFRANFLKMMQLRSSLLNRENKKNKKTIERNDCDVCILFYGNFRLFKMRLDGFLLCFLLGAIFTVLTPIEAAEEFGCPSNCHCSTDFTAVKCPGMEAFPVFNFSGSVQTL